MERPRRGACLRIAALVLSLSAAAIAAGPGQVATLSRSSWPVAFRSEAEFDQASRVALLSYAQVLIASDTMAAASMKQSFGIKSFDSAFFQGWKQGTWERLRVNFNLASRQAASGPAFFGHDLDGARFRSAAGSFTAGLPEDWRPLLPALRDFWTAYFREQGRLAALFPKVSSEIAVFDSTEIQGYDLEDRRFLLTFDDGPTRKGGTTDTLLAALRKRHLTAVFFVLGDHLDARLRSAGLAEVRGLFQGMNTQLHGLTHVSHAKLTDWRMQVLSLHARVDSVLGTPPGSGFFFRPPYGQRIERAALQLAEAKGRIMLWNIDSQDWNAKVSGEEAAGRCLALMLLWRRGILLFHDIHPKAQVAVPLLYDWLKHGGIVWMDANQAAGLRQLR